MRHSLVLFFGILNHAAFIIAGFFAKIQKNTMRTYKNINVNILLIFTTMRYKILSFGYIFA